MISELYVQTDLKVILAVSLNAILPIIVRNNNVDLLHNRLLHDCVCV